MKVDLQELTSNLEKLYDAENKIAFIIQKSGLRFSTNKITADLGEFYAFRYLSESKKMFESISTSNLSNSEFDLFGILSSNSVLKKYFETMKIRIEVKTRRNQKGIKYLSSLKPEKFDLLCVVDIAQNYSLNKILLVTSETAEKYLDKKYQRLIFKENMAFMSI